MTAGTVKLTVQRSTGKDSWRVLMNGLVKADGFKTAEAAKRHARERIRSRVPDDYRIRWFPGLTKYRAVV